MIDESEVRGRISINSRSMDSSGTERGQIIIESQYDDTLSREVCVMILVGGLWMTKRQIRIGEWYHINRTCTYLSVLRWNLIPFLVLEGSYPRVCIRIIWILYRQMKRERTEIGEYRFWVSHLLCSVCLSCAEYTHIVYVYVRLFARIIFFSWLHHAWSLSIWCATKPPFFNVRIV